MEFFLSVGEEGDLSTGPRVGKPTRGVPADTGTMGSEHEALPDRGGAFSAARGSFSGAMGTGPPTSGALNGAGVRGLPEVLSWAISPDCDNFPVPCDSRPVPWAVMPTEGESLACRFAGGATLPSLFLLGPSDASGVPTPLALRLSSLEPVREFRVSIRFGPIVGLAAPRTLR